jgi:drug/metabolite transporter (DMT)-like permease
MTDSSKNRGYFFNSAQLNLAILLIATSGPLGKYIDVPIPLTIGTRALLAAMILWGFIKWKKQRISVDKKDRKTIYLSGLLMGAHWITYFYALQLSNVAIGMLSLYTFPVITVMLEPIILKTKPSTFHLMLGFLILGGVYFLVPDFDIENTQFKAVAFGIFSAICYALRNIIMKAKVDKYSGAVLMVNQLLIISLCCLPLFFVLDTSKIIQFLPHTLLLAVVTTAIGHSLLVYSFKHFSIVSASILSCLQPVYGILLGIYFLNDIPSFNTMIGGLIILSAVVLESIRSYRKNRFSRPSSR